MARRVTWSAPALEDLTAAAEYIGRDSRHYAAALVRDARDAARSLDRFPERGRLLGPLGPNVRELFVQSYRLIYEVRRDAIDILAFVHGARDLAAWWEREQR
ncbi:MAG TPA: type II toxin-antitoxin system RelE/ParE family toxin [Thermoanaerobaculia bacterium]|nr:type II toxin-antitoxin system RelE/ParE family toxin [Thermoanaerobaculia bacterium]